MRKRVRNLGRLAAALGLVMSMTGMTAMAEGAPVIFIGGTRREQTCRTSRAGFA